MRIVQRHEPADSRSLHRHPNIVSVIGISRPDPHVAFIIIDGFCKCCSNVTSCVSENFVSSGKQQFSAIGSSRRGVDQLLWVIQSVSLSSPHPWF